MKALFGLLLMLGPLIANADKEWSPKPGEPCDISRCEGAPTASALKGCVGNLVFEQDAILQKSYNSLYDSLPKEQKNLIKSVQKEWIQFKGENEVFALNYFRPDSAPVYQVNCQVTRHRIIELEHLASFEDGNSQRLNTRYPVVMGRLDYSNGSVEEASGDADAFMSALESYSGSVIELRLEIIPNQSDLGYKLSRQGPADQNIKTRETDRQIRCGDGTYGVVDNYHYGLELSFQHPLHFHSPTKIHVGERSRFPATSVVCGAKDYTSKQYTSLYVSGVFFVESAVIPTAMEKILYPVGY